MKCVKVLMLFRVIFCVVEVIWLLMCSFVSDLWNGCCFLLWVVVFVC